MDLVGQTEDLRQHDGREHRLDAIQPVITAVAETARVFALERGALLK